MEGGFSNLIGLLTLDLVRSGIYIFFHFLKVTFVYLCVVETAPHDPQASPSTGGWWGRVRGCRGWTLHLHLFVFSFPLVFWVRFQRWFSPHTPDAAIIPWHGLQSEPKVPNASKTTRLVALCRTIQYIAAGCRRFCLIDRLCISLYIYIYPEKAR